MNKRRRLVPRAQTGGSFGFGGIGSGFNVGGASGGGTRSTKPMSFFAQGTNPKLDTSLPSVNSKKDGWLGMGTGTKTGTGGGDGGGGGGGMGGMGGIGKMASGLAGMIGGAIIGPEKQSSDFYGVSRPDTKHMQQSATLGGVTTGMEMGAEIGGMFGPWGTAIGLAVGGIGGGLFGAEAGRKKAKQSGSLFLNEQQSAMNTANRDKYSGLFNAMAKEGMKLQVNRLLTKFDKKKKVLPVFKAGGTMPSNIIPKGTLHKENNDIDGKDKGIPVVSKDGTKLFEIEKEEFILNLDSTKMLEDLVGKYNMAEDNALLIDLGKMMYAELLGNTQDNTQKFVENEA